MSEDQAAGSISTVLAALHSVDPGHPTDPLQALLSYLQSGVVVRIPSSHLKQGVPLRCATVFLLLSFLFL